LKTLQFDIVSIFPEMFASPFNESILKRAQEKGLLKVVLHDLRDYTLDKHKNVDDAPFGGGVGMVMKVEPIVRAIEAIKEQRPHARTLLMTPGSRPFDQGKAEELADADDYILICGRYEGVDERLRQYIDEEISIGDFILSGGELAAMAVVDAVTRLRPGVLGDENSIVEESFSSGLLEYPQYTRPRDFRGHQAPEILVSGDPKKIKNWQREQALLRTAKLRPDLLKDTDLTESERQLLENVDIA